MLVNFFMSAVIAGKYLNQKRAIVVCFVPMVQLNVRPFRNKDHVTYVMINLKNLS